MRVQQLYWAVTMMGILGGLWFLGCAASPPEHHIQARQAVIDTTKDHILSCAGRPIQETQTNQGTVLRYYKEASMFEESAVFLKGSRPGAHHGCWANLLVADNRIVGAEYISAPESLEEVHLCEQIFESCIQ